MLAFSHFDDKEEITNDKRQIYSEKIRTRR